MRGDGIFPASRQGLLWCETTVLVEKRMPRQLNHNPIPRQYCCLVIPAVFCLVFACFPSWTAAQQFEGYAALTWQRIENDQITIEDFQQIYRLRYKELFSESLSFTLGILASDYSNHQWGGWHNGSSYALTQETETSSDFHQAWATGQLAFILPKFQVLGTYNRYGTSFDTYNLNERIFETTQASLNWQPDLLPTIGFAVTRTAIDDSLGHYHTIENSVRGNLSKTIGPFNFMASTDASNLEDKNLNDIVLTSVGGGGNVAFNDSYWEGRLVSEINASYYETHREERIGWNGNEFPGTIPVRVTIWKTSSVIDDSPLDSRDHPAESMPGLHDGLYSGIGIPLGPRSESFRNIVLDFGRHAEINQIRLIVRDPSGNLVESGGPLTWSVYVSEDAIDWRPILGDATGDFLAGPSFYRVSFPMVKSRHLKLVSFGINVIATELVEVEALKLETVLHGDRQKTVFRVASANGFVSARPIDLLTLSWSGLWSRAITTPNDYAESRTDDYDTFASILLDPVEWTKLTVAYQKRGSRFSYGDGFGQASTPDVVQTFTLWTADLRFVPWPGLDGTIEGSRSVDDFDGDRIESDGVALRGHTKFWDAIDLGFDLGQQHYDLVSQSNTATRRYADTSVIVLLTETITARGEMSFGRSEYDYFSGTDETAFPVSTQDDQRWWGEISWRPGEQLLLSCRYGEATVGDTTSGVRGFRLQWNPFLSGQVRIETLYDEDVDTTGDRISRRLSVTPTWNISRNASLILSYLLFDLEGTTSFQTRMMSATFVLRM